MVKQWRWVPMFVLGLSVSACGDARQETTTGPTGPERVTSVAIEPGRLFLRVSQTGQLTATARGASGTPLSGRPVSWTSSAATVASVSETGIVTALASGDAIIEATIDGRTATASVQVTPVPVARVVVSPDSARHFVGASVSFTAVARDSAGNSLSGRTVQWSSDAPSVASVNAEGVVTTLAVGTARISATIEGERGGASITVVPIPVARVTVSPATITLRPWETATLSATLYDSLDRVLPARPISWRAGNGALVSVSPTGVVRGDLLGTTIVTGTVEGRSDSAAVRVTVPGPIWASPPVEVAPGSETHVAINPLNPQNLVVSSNFSHNYSLDGGRSWRTQYWQGIAPAAEADPTVSFDDRGILYRQGLSLFTNPRHLYVDVSTDQGVTLTRRAAYQPTLAEGNPDQGILAVDTVTGSPFRGSLYLIFSDYPNPQSAACRGFCLRVITSRDSGRTWSSPVDISDEPRLAQEHSSYLTIGPHGEIYAAWWDLFGRIMFARSLDGGRTWGPSTLVRQGSIALTPFPISDDVRGNVTIDVDRSRGPYRGRIYVSAVDVNGPFGGAADAWMVHSTNGGASWSAPVLLSDGPRGAFRYYFQPRISVAPNGRVDAVWYDTRNSITADINMVPFDVYFARSSDGGRSFSPSVRVSATTAVKRTNCVGNSRCGDRQLFEYIGLVSDNARSIAAWADVRPGLGPVPGAGNGQRIAVAVVWHTP